MKRRQLLKLAVASLGTPFAIARPDTTSDIRIFMYSPQGRTRVEEAFEEYLRIHRPDARFYFHDVVPADEALMHRAIEDIRRQRPTLVYTWGTLTTLRIAGRIEDIENGRGDHISDIPIVFASVTQPVAAGIVRECQHPGRNVTGISHIVPLEMQVKTIGAYRAFTKLGMIYNPAEPNSVWVRDGLFSVAHKAGFTLIAYAVPLDSTGKPQGAAIPSLLKAIKAEGATWLYMGPDAFIAGAQQRTQVVDVCYEIGLPIFAATEGPVKASKALLGLFIRHEHIGAHAARKAKLILEGRKPESIPIDTPQKFSLVVNMDAADHYGLMPPAGMLDLAETARPITQGGIH